MASTRPTLFENLELGALRTFASRIVMLVVMIVVSRAHAQTANFTLHSPDLVVGGPIAPEQYWNNFGCNGDNERPALSSVLAAFGTDIRMAIDEAANSGDQDTSDQFTEISRAIDKSLWFIEAHHIDSPNRRKK